MGIDFLAQRASQNSDEPFTIAVEHKFYRSGRPVGLDAVAKLVAYAARAPFDRVLLISNTPFTNGAREAAKRIASVAVELFDPAALEAWVDRVIAAASLRPLEVEDAIRIVCQHFAELIARDPRNLDKLESRELEKTMAEIFEGLGFRVTLTPGSKDGGKDLILSCVVHGQHADYVVELKHWRSGKGVGGSEVTHFLNVVVNEDRAGGLFLSTSGYTDSAFEELTEISRQRVKFGDHEKVYALAQRYTRARAGIWSPPLSLPELLFEETV